MDWYVPPDHEASSQLRAEVAGYLRRHAVSGSDVAGAELAFSELLTNAVEHSGNDVWVSLDWTGRKPIVTIHDLGERFDVTADAVGVEAIQGRGLMIASHLTEELGVVSRAAGGNRVTAVLKVERAADRDHDPVAVTVGRLPEMSEADEGFFERESFLRALTVEMAHAVDMQHGPNAAEVVIGQIGTNVGQRMESAHREHLGLSGELTPAQIADLYVGLKDAIGGDFYVVEVGHDRIVLGNRECPFGRAVQHAPSLCRMTSSVFGGIAARNTQREVAVQLEERIALGDPECRVTIWLQPPPAEHAPFVHRYRAGSAAP